MSEENKPSKFRLIFGIIMVFFYLLMAIVIIFSKLFDMSELMRWIVGILFFAYGLFRGFRLYKQGV